MNFNQLNLIEPILKAVTKAGYTIPTPIQQEAIPAIMTGRDVMGAAQTGTGKTAAFAIPMLQNLSKTKRNQRVIRALILAPTRELAIQIQESFETYGAFLLLKSLVIYGGVHQNPQTRSLQQGTDILVATPGRLLDLIKQKFVILDHVEYFVLDEADRMLDMGMIEDVRKIVRKLPEKRQNLFFSATMPEEVMKLAQSILRNQIKIHVTPEKITVDLIKQSLYRVEKQDKIRLLLHLLKNKQLDSVLIFSRTKHGSDKIVKQLVRSGVEALAIHGNKSQNARQNALSKFKDREVRVLVATDIAARGIDIDGLNYVINYDLPEVAETYVHRIGRGGRAGAVGTAISFCSSEETQWLKGIERLIKKEVPVIDHPYTSNVIVKESLPEKKEIKGASKRVAKKTYKREETRSSKSSAKDSPRPYAKSSSKPKRSYAKA